MRSPLPSCGALAVALLPLALLACAGAPPAATGPGDIVALPAGKAVDLVGQARPGKLTIYDFYAEWCSPCRVVGPRLEQLARSRPSDVALRKVDVIDWDSEAAVRQGIEFLPYLAVVSPEGRLLAQGSDSYALLKARFGLDLVAELRGG